MFIVRKIFKFEAAHRLVEALTERCKGIHGHSYKVEVFLQRDSLQNDLDMVMDFSEVTRLIAPVIDKFDHTLILSREDPLFRSTLEGNLDGEIMCTLNSRWMIVPYNPTAEMMALHIHATLHKLFWDLQEGDSGDRIYISKVRLHETDTGYAETDCSDKSNSKWGNLYYRANTMEKGVIYSDAFKVGLK